jgi:hypothetical protein
MTNAHALFSWLDNHPAVHLGFVAGVIALATGLAVVPLLRGPRDATTGHDWPWAAMIAIMLFAGRWPTLFFEREFNQDESLLLAGAHALTYDPVFWRSVEGGTVGPLDFFALWPAGWLFGWDSYFTARITALVLLAATLILAHQCLAIMLDRQTARIAGLAAVCFESLTYATELLHYSTELLPMVLLTATCYAAVRRWELQGGVHWNALGGLLLGGIPFAKLQVVPLGLFLGAGWVLAEFMSKAPDMRRRIFLLVGGAIVPVLLFAVQLTIAGEWANMIIPYFSYNVHYSQLGHSLGTLFKTTLQFSRMTDSLLHLWLPGTVLWILLIWGWRQPASPSARRFGWLSVGLCATAVVCTLYPQRAYLHYWQLMVVPLIFLLGAGIHRFMGTVPPHRERWVRWLLAAYAVGLTTVLLFPRLTQTNPYLGNLALFRQFPRSELSDRVAHQARPGDVLAIWGWTIFVHVETGLRQITREACSVRSMEPSPYQEFYRRRYLNDFIQSAPDLFLDSVGPHSTIYQDPAFTHDRNFPALAAVIQAHYVQVDEFQGARIYRLRNQNAR